MKSYRKNLPPLDTLVFFESAARHMSFTGAAAELFVSQAAVSKRIQQLESWLGVPAFERRGRRIRKTPAGERLAERVAMSLDFLDQSIAAIRVPAEKVVTIASMSSVAMFWLQPRLRVFALGSDACAFNLVSTDRPSDILSAETDLAVIYSDGVVPGWEGGMLIGERLVPVAAPSIVKAREGFADLFARSRELPLLDYSRRGPDWINWDRWAELTGNPLVHDWPKRRCASYLQTVGLALEGEGVALGSRPLLEDEIASGRLVALSPDELVTSKGYYVLHRSGVALSKDAERVKRALLQPGHPGRG